jgi:membrane protein implicated in regulation of membrane protease activity
VSALAWLLLAVAALVVEAGTTGVVAVYIAFGAIVAAVFAAAGLPAWMQLAAFAVTAALSLAATRRVVVRRLTRRGRPQGIGEVVGRRGVVAREIAPGAPGLVRVEGETWTAEAYAGVGPVLPVGTPVDVLERDGLVVHVAPAHDDLDLAPPGTLPPPS